MSASDLGTRPQSDGTVQSNLFRRGRLAMGWSPAMLARTLLVSELVVLAWEEGSRPIPLPVLGWVATPCSNAPDNDADVIPTGVSMIEPWPPLEGIRH
jgi:hypothetical protein